MYFIAFSIEPLSKIAEKQSGLNLFRTKPNYANVFMQTIKTKISKFSQLSIVWYGMSNLSVKGSESKY